MAKDVKRDKKLWLFIILSILLYYRKICSKTSESTIYFYQIKQTDKQTPDAFPVVNWIFKQIDSEWLLFSSFYSLRRWPIFVLNVVGKKITVVIFELISRYSRFSEIHTQHFNGCAHFS